MDPHPVPAAVKLAFGIIGNIIGGGVNLAPMPTFWKIYKAKSTKGFSALPYVFSLVSALLWVLYGLPMVTQHALLLITINAISCGIQIFYLTIFLTYAAEKTRNHVIKIMAACFVFLGAAAVVTLRVVHQRDARSRTVGCLCVVLGVITYASPLSVARMVILTRSVEFLPILLCVALFINSSVWLCYGMFTNDIFVLIPNGLGVFFGAAQIALYATYRNAKPFDDFSNSDVFAKSTVYTPDRNSGKVGHATVIEMPTDVFAKTTVYTPDRKPVKSGGNLIKAPAPSPINGFEPVGPVSLTLLRSH